MTQTRQSRSPFNETYHFSINPVNEEEKIRAFISNGRPVVVVQGLGFVGTAMAAALSNANDSSGQPLYSVIGVDLADESNYWKIARVNEGKAPVHSSDVHLAEAFVAARRQGNMMATYADFAFSAADVVVVDINLDVQKSEPGQAKNYHFDLKPYLKALRSVARHIRENTLVLIESTVPPGTTQKEIYPLFRDVFAERELDVNRLYLAHSYERVMPGKHYLHSITDYYRVFAGINAESAKQVRQFLESFINTQSFPLTELHSTTASEMAKVLENSYRAMNIAFMQEWTELAEQAEVNLFEVIEAIRKRDTHRNIMAPGFGVGGYCLTKDSLLADWAAETFFNIPNPLPMSLSAIDVNDRMPEHTFKILSAYFKNLAGKRILLFGVSYLNDVADTRHTPAGLFYDLCTKAGAEVVLHDTMVRVWDEKQLPVFNRFEDIAGLSFDAAVFAVRHEEYLRLDAAAISGMLSGIQLIVDANNIISDRAALGLAERGIAVKGVGKGHWNQEINL